MKKLHQTKNPELIIPTNKIAPPPPNLFLQNNKSNHFQIILFTLVTFILVAGCTDGTSPPSIVPQVPIAEILSRSATTYNNPTLKPDNYRVSIALFSVKMSAGQGEYQLAIRQADQTAPKADDIRESSATIIRKLSAEPINVFISFHMDTDLFDTNMTWTNESGVSILTDTLLDGARLKPDTSYALYAVTEDEGTVVHKLADFSTDPYPADNVAGTDIFAFSFPPVEHSFVIRKGEPFFYEVVVMNKNAIFFQQGSSQMSECSNNVNQCIKSSYQSKIGVLNFLTKNNFAGTKGRASSVLKSITSSLESGASYIMKVTDGNKFKFAANFIME